MLRVKRDEVDGLLSEIDRSLRMLNKIRAQYEIAKSRGSALRAECGEFVSDQKDLIEYADALVTQLRLFDDLEHLSRSFANAAANVTQISPFSIGHPEFSNRLQQVDDIILGLAKLQSPEAQEAVSRAVQLRARVASHTKTAFHNLLKTSTASILSQFQVRRIVDVIMF